MAMRKRILSAALALVLLLSCVPMTAAAVETEEPTITTEATAEAPAETTEALAEVVEEPTEETTAPAEEPVEETAAPTEAPTEAPAEEPTEPVTEPIETEEATATQEAVNAISNGTCGENAAWTFDDSTGTLTISGAGEMTSFPWQDSFASEIVHVEIGEGITRIGSYAFYDCINLNSVIIPDTVTHIGQSAFQSCENLNSITIPGSVYNIGSSAFSGCSSLTSAGPIGGGYDYEFGWTSFIPANAFWGCDELTSVVLPDTLSQIGDFAFAHTRLKYISIPDGVTGIGDAAFRNSGLCSITIPDGVITIQDRTFLGCTCLTSVILPDGLRYIDQSAFQDCFNLASIAIPNSVDTIDDYAFDGCWNLTSITIPSAVTSIGNYAFGDCSNLTRITFQGNCPSFTMTTLQRYLRTFYNVTATAYYPAGNSTWTADVMQDYGGDITWVPYKVVPAVPARPYKIVNVVSGVHVYWRAVNGAVKYGVWRSETGKDGTYKWLGNPTVPHFTDTTAQSGKTYYYRVTSVDADGQHSDKSEAIGIAFVSTPDITTRANIAAGVQLGWNKITGATGYAIYRKSYDGTDAWVRIGTIPGNETFTWTDESVKNNNGQIYRYTIRALAGTNMATLSGCRPAGRTMARLSSQVLRSAVKASATSAKCTWTTSSRVTGYEVRFMVGDTVYKTFTVGNWKTGVKTFTGLPTGKTYTVQVRTYKKVDGVGSFYSDWSTAKTVTLK